MLILLEASVKHHAQTSCAAKLQGLWPRVFDLNFMWEESNLTCGHAACKIHTDAPVTSSRSRS